MKKVKCPKCKSDVPLDISKAVDADGEVFRCKNCNYLFRYVEH
jgi:transposase-like protein